MQKINEIIIKALRYGFTSAGQLKMDSLIFMPEVREMCSADKCGHYDKNWSCPPACGTLEEITEKAKTYTFGVLVQTTGQLEDDFDYESMKKTEALHKENFLRFVEALQKDHDLLPMAAGACTFCTQCTCPDEPCRFPEKAFSSMEAYGLWVSRVCELSGLPYNYGERTITYTSCILLI